MIWRLDRGEEKHTLAISTDVRLFNLFMCCKAFFAHLYTGNPNTHCSDDLQMVQDEFLQFGDAAALNEKQSTSLCRISWRGSVTEVSLQTNVMYTVRI